jgi:aspartyl-tRNA(Asn)/glutamyl-tRNA(Gln) amidotransferase subunit B
MEGAVEYEIKRQESVLKAGGAIEKQTLGWDDAKQATFPQRSKEGSADYRYFPDPDLPSLRLSELPQYDKESLKASIGELPAERRGRYVAIGMKPDDADAFVRDRRFGDFFDAVSEGMSPAQSQIAGNYIANDLVKIVRDLEERDTKILDNFAASALNFRKLVALIDSGSVTSRAAKDILGALMTKDQDPEEYARANNLISIQDTSALEGVVRSVIEAHPSVLADYRAGKEAALEFLLGQCMRQLKGAGSPETLRGLLKANMAV